MVLFNHATREMTAKIVYYGPGLCGKTTNLLVIYEKLDSQTKGKMLSLATRSDRTLFFDLLPVELGKVGSFNLKIQLYTVPGQVFYNETRKLVLRGADSVVFVVDSQPSMLESNRESFENLFENLRENRIDPEDLPIVVQYNKRDIPGVLSVREIQKKIGLDRYPSIEASAIQGEGVMETFKLVSKLTARKLMQRMKGAEAETEQPADAVPEVRPESVDDETTEETALPGDLGQQMEEVSTRFSVANIAAAELGPTLNRGDVMPPFEEVYDRMEEVSLEQLLEGRDRPATVRSEEPVAPPEEEIEDLPEAYLLPDLAEAVPDRAEEPPPEASDVPQSEAPEVPQPEAAPEEVAAAPTTKEHSADEIAALRAEVAELRTRQEEIVSTLERVVTELTSLLKRSSP